jgi:hypothetical protein
VIGQRKDRHGRWCVGIRYYPNATIGESGGWYLLDRSKIRRPGLACAALLARVGHCRRADWRIDPMVTQWISRARR